MSCFGKVSVMRKFLITLLLASAAASPAFAGPRDGSDNNQQTHEDHQQAREARQQAHEQRAQARDEARAERSQRPEFVPQARMQPQAQFAGRPQFNGGGRFQQQQQQQQQMQQVDMEALRAQRQARSGSFDGRRGETIEQVQQRFDQRQQQVRNGGDFRQSNRQFPQVMRDRHPLVVSDTPRPGTQPPLRVQGQREMHWNRDWRNDRDHDWRRFRDHHRSRFHIGFYIDPFGWGYQPFDIGYRMWPAYYGNQYYIDPAEYGLPYPPPGAEWIRYYNDALLIDTYTGTVIDSIPGFFY
jgi:Ni/Co efflux regulator RcnB